MREVRDAIANILDLTTLMDVNRRVDRTVQEKRGPDAREYDI